MKKVLIVLADGFEEIEAISIIDILRRGKVKVTIAANDEIKLVNGAHDIQVYADKLLSEVADDTFDMVVLPGGEPGTTNLENNTQLAELIKRQAQSDRWCAAICAAPRILNNLGLLVGKEATSHPTAKSNMAASRYSDSRVVVSGKVVTSRGPGTAMEFAYTLLKVLGQEEAAESLPNAMVMA